MNSPLIQLEAVSRSYGGDELRSKVHVLKDMSLMVHAGEYICITGPSGSGKSTLLNILGCLDRPSGGCQYFKGEDITDLDMDGRAHLRRENIGFVFQSYQLIEHLSAVGNVEIPARYAGLEEKTCRQRAKELLASLGLSDRLEHRPPELSGGEKQRVAVARALMNGGRLILADEPTAALDEEQGEKFLNLLQELSDRGHTIIVASHNRKVANRADRRLEILDGRLVADSGGRTAAEKVVSNVAKLSTASPSLSRRIAAAVQAFRIARQSVLPSLLCAALGIASLASLLGFAEGIYRKGLELKGRDGADIIQIYPDWEKSAHVIPPPLPTLEDAAAIRRLANVRAAEVFIYEDNVPISGPMGEVRTVVTTLSGHQPIIVESAEWPIEEGDYITLQDNEQRSRVVVLEPWLASQLFDDGEPIVGETILIKGIPFLVKGVLGPHPVRHGPAYAHWDESMKGGDAHIPYTTGDEEVFGPEILRRFNNVVVSDPLKVEQTAQEILDLLIRRNGEDWFGTRVFQQERQEYWNEIDLQRTLLIGIGLLAAILGGGGVMAVTLSALSTRIPEIGIRLACGADSSAIRLQFLIEAGIVSLLGGLIGCLLTLACWYVAAIQAEVPFIPSPQNMIISVAAGLVSCVLFGVVPARRASKLDPVDSLREA